MKQGHTDESLAEMLSLTCTVGDRGAIYYANSEGELHRVHGPAAIYPDGSEHWCRDGARHRDDGPAVIYSDGSCHWYQNGHRHRSDGPAVIYSNGGKLWYLNGELHSDHGPAAIYSDGTISWYWHGNPLTECEWRRRIDYGSHDAQLSELPTMHSDVRY